VSQRTFSIDSPSEALQNTEDVPTLSPEPRPPAPRPSCPRRTHESRYAGKNRLAKLRVLNGCTSSGQEVPSTSARLRSRAPPRSKPPPAARHSRNCTVLEQKQSCRFRDPSSQLRAMFFFSTTALCFDALKRNGVPPFVTSIPSLPSSRTPTYANLVLRLPARLFASPARIRTSLSTFLELGRATAASAISAYF